jgi:hypothetical protein
MREIISIGIGSYGINTTDAFLKELAHEHPEVSGKVTIDPETLKESYPEIFF